MALAATPQLLTTTVDMPPASEGGSLVVRGHGFSLVDAENWVMVGGEPCAVNSATVDGSYVHPPCPVASCTDDLPLIMMTCTLPPNHAFGAHAVTAGVYGLGAAPARSGAAVTYAVQLRGAAPAGDSLGGGTLLTLSGDGLSARKGDIEVTVGGAPCPRVPRPTSRRSSASPPLRRAAWRTRAHQSKCESAA